MPTNTKNRPSSRELKAAAVAEAAGKAKPASKGKAAPKAPAPRKTFPDANGMDIKKGDRVKHKGSIIGTAAYRVMDGKRHVPRIGVELASTGAGQAVAAVKGRTLKRRCFDAADLTVVTK